MDVRALISVKQSKEIDSTDPSLPPGKNDTSFGSVYDVDQRHVVSGFR
jgi:hypothetical protein